LQNSGVSPAGDTTNFQGTDSFNFGDAGEFFGANLAGGGINTVNGGGSFVLGQGGFVLGALNNAAPNSGRKK